MSNRVKQVTDKKNKARGKKVLELKTKDCAANGNKVKR